MSNQKLSSDDGDKTYTEDDQGNWHEVQPRTTAGDITVYVPAGYDGPKAVFTDKAEADRYQTSNPDLEGVWTLVLNRWPE